MEESTKSSLGHFPSTKNWSFDAVVTDVFPDMLRRSIPQYEVMRRAVYDVGVNFVVPSTYLVDLGCSRGDGLAPFVSNFGSTNRFLGVDKSAPMIGVARERFTPEIEKGIVSILDQDLCVEYPQVESSLTLCILTLQFISPDQRLQILSQAHRSTVPGGALILVEKVLGASETIDCLMIRLYHELKRSNGYSPEEIERKRASLEGVLTPFSTEMNLDLLRSAGFREVDSFWRWMNFIGLIAIK